MRGFACSDCGSVHAFLDPIWRCTSCGGLLELEPPDTGAGGAARDPGRREQSLWRYRESFPFDRRWEGWRSITMGEGMTPTVPVAANRPGLLVKVEYASPTLSFKDRGAALLVARAAAVGATHLIADSSGNAGRAIAAYAARAGLACTVFVPAASGPAKIARIARYGATVEQVGDTREATADAAVASAEADPAAFYASHVWDPTFHEGTKTFVYELWEQLGRLPDALILPVGNGTLLLGAALGLLELEAAGKIDHYPRLIAVQAARCAPLATAFAAGRDDIAVTVNEGTAAEGIAIAAPARARHILAAVRLTGGRFVAVGEDAIAAAGIALAANGFDVDPTAAATWAGFEASGAGADGETVVIPLCAAGKPTV